jgi:hypothetical protein
VADDSMAAVLTKRAHAYSCFCLHPMGTSYIYNRQPQPKITVQVGLPGTRWRMISASTDQVLEIHIEGCALELLAKDGVFVSPSPRPVSVIYLSPGSRADVLVCGTRFRPTHLCSGMVSNLTLLLIVETQFMYMRIESHASGAHFPTIRFPFECCCTAAGSARPLVYFRCVRMMWVPLSRRTEGQALDSQPLAC